MTEQDSKTLKHRPWGALWIVGLVVIAALSIVVLLAVEVIANPKESLFYIGLVLGGLAIPFGVGWITLEAIGRYIDHGE